MTTANHGLAGVLRTLLVPMHRTGLPIFAVVALATLVLAGVCGWLGWLAFIALLWTVYFFRDPERVTPVRPGLVLAPADGIVQAIAPAVPPEELGLGPERLTRISIFLNLLDVHVNRVPVDGVVERVHYRPGRFLNASLDKASEENERAAAVVRDGEGRRIAFVQIAGLVARRIVNELAPGRRVAAGERFGIIRFGSRADVYLPAGVSPLVAVGQRTVGGETVLADLLAREAPRQGAVR
jgi:phosphatidylserine decarboxylase